MATVKISFNTDAKTKSSAEELFDKLGLNMTTAINVFLKKAIEVGGIPFDVRVDKPNAETLLAMKEAE